MSIVRDVAKELLGMFLADARLTTTILILVAVVAALAVGLRVNPILCGGLLLAGSLQIVVAAVVLVSDEEMREAARYLWFDSGLAVDLSGAAAVAALLTGRVHAEAGSRTCALVCGAGADGIA